ncbi:hypothetical protein ES332_A09G165500v1 [Gossypium tomentosum]|uniref:Uncharacterized protein n=1 Tax=Gossypium tomentosum TaxID=34277 RepID=A0A5D2P3U6_GOSTO|nr:hypothetical protein ES332_A09G165500v1 [Gossypium tomentosum]
MIEQSFQFTGQDEWTTFISIAIEEGEGPRQWCPGEKRLLASARTRCESWQLCPDQDSLIFFSYLWDFRYMYGLRNLYK